MNDFPFFTNPKTQGYLQSFNLAKGDHKDQYGNIEQGVFPMSRQQMCAMEMVAYLNEEELSDTPLCTWLVVSAAMARWNDNFLDGGRRTEMLMPIIPHVVGTANPKHYQSAIEYAKWAIGQLLEQVPSSKGSTLTKRDLNRTLWESGVAPLAKIAICGEHEHLWDYHGGLRLIEAFVAQNRNRDWGNGMLESIMQQSQEHMINVCKILKGECVERGG